jgi:glycosyltransferase involved in cell wall biosynthesis
MKISQVMLAKGFGGAERLFVDLCLSLAEFNQQVQAICVKGSESSRILAQHPQIRLKTIDLMGSWDPFASRKVKNLLLQHQSQIVQAHLARGALIAGKACKRIGLPLVVTTHNYVDIKYYKNVSVLVPATSDQYAYYLDQGIAAADMKIINHFSMIEAAPGPKSENKTGIRIMALGRLVHKKGFHLLLDAFSKLPARQDFRYELIIGGSGAEKKSLTTQIQTLGLEDKVNLVGWVDDVPSFLKDGDLFVLPSLDEPFGIAILEAMAMGIPIVSSKSQGPREILDEDCAWMFENGDPESLLEVLTRASSNYQERLKRSNNALQRFRQSYSKKAVLGEFIALYDSLLIEKNEPYQH